MKKRILAVTVLFALALGCLPLAGCAPLQPAPGKLLQGQWKGDVAGLEFNALEFVQDSGDPNRGAVRLGLVSSLISARYETERGQGKDAPAALRITYTLLSISTTRSYTFTVTGGLLTLIPDGGGLRMSYRKAASTAGTAR